MALNSENAKRLAQLELAEVLKFVWQSLFPEDTKTITDAVKALAEARGEDPLSADMDVDLFLFGLRDDETVKLMLAAGCAHNAYRLSPYASARIHEAARELAIGRGENPHTADLAIHLALEGRTAGEALSEMQDAHNEAMRQRRLEAEAAERTEIRGRLKGTALSAS